MNQEPKIKIGVVLGSSRRRARLPIPNQRVEVPASGSKALLPSGFAQ
jgi:hypothetical protein